jgi:4-hydroxythreonine-4-phosphate dehydrogenase
MHREDVGKPVVGITVGEVCGIGPEILVKALSGDRISSVCRPLIVGDGAVLEKAAELCGLQMNWVTVVSVAEAEALCGNEVVLLDLKNVSPDDLTIGHPNAATGRAMLEYTETLVELLEKEIAHAGVGGPHSKAAAGKAGYDFVGYPYFIADLLDSGYPFLLLVASKTRIANVTLHVSLKRAIEMINSDLVAEAIRAVYRTLQFLGIPDPTIAVSALNPHAGEEGMFGTEENEHIGPAIETARAEGINALGPFPADSLFYQCTTNPRYDAYVAMYHDQAHIPIKVEAFRRASAVSIGLPVLFATVDHGCALDIAWKAVADPEVLVETVKLMAEMARRKFDFL